MWGFSTSQLRPGINPATLPLLNLQSPIPDVYLFMPVFLLFTRFYILVRHYLFSLSGGISYSKTFPKPAAKETTHIPTPSVKTFTNEESAMKIAYSLALLLFLPVCYAEESAGKVCLNIPERGAETVIIEHNCKKGDIIQLNKLHVANLCDFNSAIINYDGKDQFVCVYLGKKREPRVETNYQ